VSCERIEKLWRRYASGDLSGAKRRRFQDHLKECADCRARKRALDHSAELAARALAAPEEMTPAEWNRVRPPADEPVARGRRPLAAALAAAACAAVIGAILYLAPESPVEERSDAGAAMEATKPLGEADRYEVRMCTEDPKVKIVWVFDRNLTL
jgi:predicted anti-sigma-YlaC factor YlaD